MESPIDIDNPVIQLCLAGARAEFEGNPAQAHCLYLQAWDIARDDYEACIAAHYMARHQDSVQEVLRWNQEALARAEAVGDARVEAFYPSLYLNLGHSYELTGNRAEAEHYYALASALGFEHSRRR
ncbi:MAG TPA: hypothetical protein VLC95_11160 [Anaerolineae bacterium]|nr:hypothetical protein [Anaerolineae bacterium]